MDLEKKENPEVQDEESSTEESSAELLEELREQMASPNPSVRRQAAFNLSWLQEDGLEILKETLFGNTSKSSKTAAAYGLRKMRGRMKKMARSLFEEGQDDQDDDTRDVCKTAMMVIEQGGRQTAAEKAGNRKISIQEVKAGRKKRRGGKRPHVRGGNRGGNRRR